MVMKPIRFYIVLYMEPFLMQGCGWERMKPLLNNDMEMYAPMAVTIMV